MKLKREHKIAIGVAVLVILAVYFNVFNLQSFWFDTMWQGCTITDTEIVCIGSISDAYEGSSPSSFGIPTSCKYYSGGAFGDANPGIYCQNGNRRYYTSSFNPANCKVDFTLQYRCKYEQNWQTAIQTANLATFDKSTGNCNGEIPMFCDYASATMTVTKVVVPYASVTTTINQATTVTTTSIIPNPDPIQLSVAFINELFEGIWNIVKQILGWHIA